MFLKAVEVSLEGGIKISGNLRVLTEDSWLEGVFSDQAQGTGVKWNKEEGRWMPCVFSC